MAKDSGYTVIGYLLAGMVFYGGLGWLADHFLHTSWLVAVGIVIGMMMAVYLVMKRFGEGAA